MSTSTPAAPAPLPAIPWFWFILVGAICLIAGLLGIVHVGMAELLTQYGVLFFGILMTIAGAGYMLGSIFVRPWLAVILKFGCGALYLLAGVFAIVEPLLAVEIY